MKRGRYEDGMAPPEKRLRTAAPNREYSFNILVPKFCAGAVIGRSGSTITRLQGTYRVRVQVQPRNQITQDSLFRGILLRGRWLDVMEAQKEIIRLIDDDVLKQNGDSSLHNLWGSRVPLAVPQNLMHVMNNAASMTSRAAQALRCTSISRRSLGATRSTPTCRKYTKYIR